MNPAVLITIVGSFLTVMLGINAFFLRGIYSDINDVKINMATIIANSKNKEKRLDDLEGNQKEIFHRLQELEKQV